MDPKVLIVEDEADIASALSARLKNEGFSVTIADNGDDGLDLGLEEDFALAIIDIMLPGKDGLTVAKTLKEHKHLQVLILSARDDEDDVVSGLEIGADDYVTKPFSIREVVARVHALLRRKDSNFIEQNDSKSIQSGSLVVDPSKFMVTLKGKSIHTTPTEFRLLYQLISYPNKVFTREELVTQLAHDSDVIDEESFIASTNTRTVDSHIRSLRKKIGANYIRTVHSIGYSFEPENSQTKAIA